MIEANRVEQIALYSCAPDQLPGANGVFVRAVASGVVAPSFGATRAVITGGGQAFDYYVHRLPDPNMTEADAHWRGLVDWAQKNNVFPNSDWRGVRERLLEVAIPAKILVESDRGSASPALVPRAVGRFAQWPEDVPLTQELISTITNLVFVPNHLSESELATPAAKVAPLVIHLGRQAKNFAENAQEVQAINRTEGFTPRRLMIVTLSWASNRARRTRWDPTGETEVVVQSYAPRDPLQVTPITAENWFDDSLQLIDGSPDRITAARVISELPRLLIYSETKSDGQPGDVRLSYEERGQLELIEGRLQERGRSLRRLEQQEIKVR